MSDYPPSYPAPETALEPPPPPSDDQGTSFVDALSSSVDQVIIQCANSSNPICYSTSISGANLITNLWFSLVLGAFCYILFIIFRGKFRFYQARLDMPQVTHKPPPLDLHGFHRLWSWLIPVFKVSDEELLLSAGMDALIAIRVLSFGILLFLPVTIAAMAILVPINFLDDYYTKEGETMGVSDSYTTIFIRLTMSNLTPGTPLMWVHFVFVYGVVFWTCWLITEHYKEYITLRQSYVIRSTALPDGALGGSMGAMDTQATPLLASRSPLKRKHILGRSNSGEGDQLFRQNSTGSSGGAGGSSGAGGDHIGRVGKVKRSGGKIRLPRRDASASGTTIRKETFAVALQHPQQQKLGVEYDSKSRAVSSTTSDNTMSGSQSRPGASAGTSRPSRLSAAPILTSNPTFSYQVSFDMKDSTQQQAQHYHNLSSSSAGGGGASSSAVDPPYEGQYSAPVFAAAGPPPLPPQHQQGKDDGTLDWTMHDFSQEIVVPHHQRTGSTNSNAENAALAAAAAAFPPRSPVRNGNGSMSRVPSFPRLMPQLSGVNPVSRVPSNAAVAAALDSYNTAATAAQAVEKIRHHRVLSGASVSAASRSQSATPVMSGTPRKIDTGSMTPVQAPSPAATVHHKRSRSSAGGSSGGISTSGTTTNNNAIAANGGPSTGVAPGGSKLTPPPDLARIIEAVNVLADQQDALDSNGDLPTVTAIAPEYAAPQGQDGIAHRWWSTLSTLGNRMVERRRSIRQTQGPIASSHSITFRGSIPMTNQLTNGGAVLAANASLYTVLVTDQPIEKLRLKRPLGNMEFWHQRNAVGHDPLGLQTSNFEEYVDPGEGPLMGPTTSFAFKSGAGAGETTMQRNGSDNTSSMLFRAVTGASPGASSCDDVGAEESSLGGIMKIMADTDAPPSPTDVERGTTTRTTTTNSNSSSSPAGMVAGRGCENQSGHRGLFKAAANKLGRAFSRPSGQSVLLADPGAVERGIGLSAGWSATLHGIREYWRHRGRYREWRRDVRWAMFNKRVRTATEMFSELFGDDFDSIVPIYPTKSVEKLIQEWDKTAAALERVQYKLKELSERKRELEQEQRDGGPSNTDECPNSSGSSSSGKGTSGRRCCNSVRVVGRVSERQVRNLKGKIRTLAEQTAALQEQISTERDAVLSDLPSTCFFATFKSQEAAAVAAQANLNPITQRLFNVQAAPSPDDVNWPALERSWWQRQARPAYVLPLILFIMLLPIGAFTGAFAQLTIAFCGSPENPGPAAGEWFCSDDRWAIFLRNILTSIAPSILLSLYHLVVLPVLVYYAAQAEGRCFSLSQLDRRCAELFFYWDVFNVFLGAMLGGSILSELPQYVDNPQAIWTTLSSAIPASSNFFINYVSYRALVMAWFRLFYPHQAIAGCILKWLHIIPWAKTARDKALEAPVRNCRYGRDIGIPVLMNFVMVLAYAVVSPLILPFGLLYFIFLWAVWRYQMLYVYQRQYESGGQFWPLVAHKVVGCLLLGVLFTAVVLIFKQGYAQAGIILVTLPLYLLRFDNYLTTRYDAVVAQVPLMAVHKAGKVVSVDPDLWTPPPLRQGAVGWNPEWGKVWQWWGVPRYTL